MDALGKTHVKSIDNAERRLRKLVLAHWYDSPFRTIKPKARLALILTRAAGEWSAKQAVPRALFLKCAAAAYDKFDNQE